MARQRAWAFALLLTLPLGVVPAACGGDERDALREEELERDLELALEGDTLPATFQDTAVGKEPEAAPAPQVAPAPRASTPPRTQPRESEQRPAPAAPRTVTMSVPTGTTFAVQLNETLATDQNAPGDAFSATVTEPIVSADGTVMIPAGATVRGRVTAVEKSDRVGETAIIKLAFETISFDGESYPLQASVVEANPERRTRTTTGQQAAKIGAGAAAGAVLGQILGKDRASTLKGAVIGAAAGTAIAMGTADVDAVLPSGSRMVVRLDAPVQVRRTVS